MSFSKYYSTIALWLIFLFLIGCTPSETLDNVSATRPPTTSTDVPPSSEEPTIIATERPVPESTNIPTPEIIEEIFVDCAWYEEVRVWLDENENGQWDENETPLAGIAVTVDDTLNSYSGVGYDETDLTGRAHPEVWLPGCPNVTFKISVELGSSFRSTNVDAYEGVKTEDRGPFDFGLVYVSDAIPTVTPLPQTPANPLVGCETVTPPEIIGYIWDIEILDSGEVWVASSSGVSRFDPETETWKNFIASDGLIEGSIRAITADTSNSFWVVSWDGEVVNFDGENWRQFTQADGLISNDVIQVSIAPDNSVWFATRDGVTKWDRETDEWISYTEEDGLFGNSVEDILFTPDGRIWFADYGAVTSLMFATNEGDEDVWEIYPESEQLRQYHSTGYDTAYVSQDGRIWFSGQRYFDSSQGNWVETIYRDFAYDLVVDVNGGLWVARGDDYGLIYIANPHETPREYWNIFGETEGIRTDVRSIEIAQDEIWLGTDGAGVFRCKISTGS